MSQQASGLRFATGASAEVVREPPRPFDGGNRPWDAEQFLDAVEVQDETTAVQLLHGAVAAGLDLDELMPMLTKAALAHYNDFGHSVIYLMHLRRLVQRLGPAVMLPLLRSWVRSLVYATREDLLPDFRAYADALRGWRDAAQPKTVALSPAAAFTGLSIKRTLEQVLGAAGPAANQLLDRLTEAAALHLLRFDESIAHRIDNPPQDNTNWLDFSNGLTFAQALRELLPANATLWPQGLLQMAMFVGRNMPWLQAGVSNEQALAPWQVGDDAAFDARCRAQVLDHGQGVDIFAVHWIKTWSAVRAAAAGGLSAGARAASLAAVNRLFAVRFKQHHARRNAHQALAFVAREA